MIVGGAGLEATVANLLVGSNGSIACGNKVVEKKAGQKV